MACPWLNLCQNCNLGLLCRLVDRSFQINRIFPILILAPKPLSILFHILFLEESKIDCISNCLNFGRSSGKSDCRVSTQKLDLFQKPAKNCNEFLRGKTDIVRNSDSSKWSPDLDSTCLQTSSTSFVSAQVLLDESSFSANFEFSSRFYSGYNYQ